MFKNMKLAAKIGAGFGALIVIALVLGGLAVWNMYSVRTIANTLVNANVPEVAVANQVERDSLNTMYQTRGYAYTEDKTFLDKARGHLQEVNDDLKKAREHAAAQNLATLKQNADTAQAKVTEYEQLLNDTVAKTDAMAKDKAESVVAADKYMKICAAFLDNQMKQLDAEIAQALVADKKDAGEAITDARLKERVRKTVLCNDVIELGNNIRVGTWQAIATRDPKLFQETERKFEQVNAKLDELKPITHREADLKEIEECRASGKEYLACMQSFLTNWFAREELGKKRNEVANAVLEAAQTTAAAGMKDTTDASKQAAGSLSMASTTMIIGLTGALVLGVVLAVFITRSIVGPISKVIDGLKAGAEQTSSASGQVAQSSQQMAEGASEQASSLEEVSSSLEEMASMTKQNADNANQANHMAGEASEAAEQGNGAMVKMAEAIQQIKTSSDQTAKILKTIDEIAFQTNLLALNAAVEAARAGEAGKGFAVVAEEVRNLAQRSAEAAKNTAALIEQSQKNADNGVAVSDDVAKILARIVQAAQKVNQLVGEVSTASTEQSQGIEQINTAIAQMDKVTQSNAANAEESASASEELSAQSKELNDMVNALVAIVGGASARTAGQAATPADQPTRRQARAVAAKADQNLGQADRALHQAWGGKAKASKTKAPAAPQEVIPLDSDELATF